MSEKISLDSSDTERIHFKGPLEISHQVPHDTGMQIQKEVTNWSSGI